MAEAFPSVILNSILKQLESPFFQRNNKINCGLGIQLRDIRSKLVLIRPVIYDAELMGILFMEFFRGWLYDLQCILHELDDLLDEALTSSLSESGMIEKVRLYLHNLSFDLTLPRKMKDINERLEGIVKQCYKCNLLVERGGTEKPIARTGILRYDAKDGEPEMIGRDEDKKKVIKMLFDEDATGPVVWIIGQAGVGKTTLCRAVYNDEEVSKHFEVRVWFGLEDIVKEFSPTDFWNKIITALDEAQPHLGIEEEDQLITKIISLVGTRKILLVLNGFPCVDFDLTPISFVFCDKLAKLNDETHGGIKALVPTNYVDTRVCNYPKYELKNDLSEDHSWSILENTALVPGHDREEWIEDLGQQIARRCLGNPALLRGVGTLLHGKQSEDDRATWEYFAHKFDFYGPYWYYVATSSAVHYLFQLFQQSVGYLRLFSENEFKYEAVMDQFAANGFTNLSSDTVRQRFKDQFLRPIIKKVDWDDADKFQYDSVLYKVIIIQLAGAHIISLGRDNTCLPKSARHVSISRPSSSTDQQQKNLILTKSLIKDVIHLRSLLFLGKWHPIRMQVQTLDTLASNLRYLRVLDLQDLALKELPSSIGKLIHVRYLDLSRNDFKELPESVCRLKNLLTLRLFYCDKLIRLPGRIKNLRHLKHLEIGMCFDLTHMPPRIAKLTCLQRLDRFLVGPRKGGLRYLEHLDHLNGHLAIELPRQWENSVEDAETANLERKKGLTTLEFKWQGTDNGIDDNDDDDVLEKLRPCTSIKNLFILHFGGTKFPRWITAPGMENHLTRITISHCKRCKILPPFHGLPNLRYLTLTALLNVEYLQDNNRSGDTSCVVPSAATGIFPSLYELRIGCMSKLSGWSRDLGGLPRTINVGTVEIWKCPRLLVMPPFSVPTECDQHLVILQDISEKTLHTIDWRDHTHVKIISIEDMVSLPNNIVTHFPRYLEIEDCNKWQTLWTNEAERTETRESLSRCFQSLFSLSIKNCHELKDLSSGLRHLIHLEQLFISKCSEEVDCLYKEDEDGMPWNALQKLSTVEIEGFKNLEAIPEGIRHLPSLEYLTIRDCTSLKWGLDSMPKAESLRAKSSVSLSPGFQSLGCLSIHNCREMKHLSSGLRYLIKLWKLNISQCSEELDCLYREDEDGMPWKAIQTLKQLEIEGFENLKAIPKGFRHLPSLDILRITDCKSLKRGAVFLPKVGFLCIKSCPRFVEELKRERSDVFIFFEQREEISLKLS